MFYYSFFVKDYLAKAAHLGPMEDLAYRRLIDEHMLTERRLPLDVAQLARKIRMANHVNAVQSVLNEFFVQHEDGFSNPRCEEEILKYQSLKEKASKAGRASAERRFNERSTSVQQEVNACSTDVQPISNQESKEKREKKTRVRRAVADESAPIALPECVPPEAWERWLRYLGEKKKPTTRSTLEKHLEKLALFFSQGYNPTELIDVSIESNWQSIFSSRSKPNNAKSTNDIFRGAI